MNSTEQDRSKVTVIDCGNAVYSVSSCFTADSKQVFSSGAEGMIRQWQVDDGRQVGEAIRPGCQVYASAISKDHKWLVCGLTSQPYARVWNAKTHMKVLDISSHTTAVLSVDISSDSTAFATGGLDKCAFVWSITTGARLVGPLQHSSTVVAVRFSPDGTRLATAAAGESIKIFHSDNGQQLLNISCPLKQIVSSPLAWSADGWRIFAASQPSNEAKCFDASSGSLLGTWPLPSSTSMSLGLSSISTSSNKKFIAITRNNALSFRDALTYEQIGPCINLSGEAYFMALSADSAYVVTGENNGKVTVRSLCGVLPDPYLIGDLPLLGISSKLLEAWTHGELTRAEQILTEDILDARQDPSRYSKYLAHRSLIRSRLKQHTLAIDDAKKSVEAQRSIIGQIAITIARVSSGEYDAAIRVFDLVFTDRTLTESSLVLLIKAIILFQCGRHDEAISRIDDLIDIVDDKTVCATVQARMYLLLAAMLLEKQNHEEAAEWLRRAGEPVIPEYCPELATISLIFGWNFDGLALDIQHNLQQCTNLLEETGDIAMQSSDAKEAITHYSVALSLNPSNPAILLVKRSKAHAKLMLWEDALKDADEAIQIDSQGPWGYQRRHIALHALQRYDDATGTMKQMVALQRHCGAGGDAALCQLLEEIMAYSGEATILAWTGQSSSYNSSLPASLAFHPPISPVLHAIQDVEMDERVSELKNSMSSTDAMLVCDRIVRLPSARFIHGRLYLPSILFPVKTLVEKSTNIDKERCYGARVSRIGQVEFQTSDTLSLAVSHKLVFAHPWIRDLHDALGEQNWGSTSDSSDESESQFSHEAEADSLPRAAPTAVAAPLYAGPIATADDYTRALQLIVRLQQPFLALLLQQQPCGEYKRVATEREIILPGLSRRTSSASEIHIGIVEVA